MPLQEKYPSFFGRQPKISVFPALTKANFFLKLKNAQLSEKSHQKSSPYPSEIIVLIQHKVTVHSSVIDTVRYFFQLILHVDLVLCNCSNSRI